MSTKKNQKEKTLSKIHSEAPIRIDLAGGTLDIWPIYLLLKNPFTVNLAIDLKAEAWLEEIECKKDESGVEMVSKDQSTTVRCGWEEFHAREELPPWVSLPWKLLRIFTKKKKGFKEKNTLLRLSTLSRSPAGAGLGGSSGLNISATGALASWAGVPMKTESDRRALIDISKDSETQVLKVPAGLQDYYGAMFGGLQKIHWKVPEHGRENLEKSAMKSLNSRLLLFYSGKTRNSGINNWVLFKSFIDGDPSVISKFESIGSAAKDLSTALQSKDWKAVTQAVSEEWAIRKTLAPGISTPEINRAIEKAKSLGGVAAKVCGAGGGGCFFILAPDDDPIRKKKISQAVSSIHSIRKLDFSASEKGLEIHGR